MTMMDDTDGSPVLQEAAREVRGRHSRRAGGVRLIGLGELDRARESAVTARVAIDAALTAVEAALK